ncbi:MAG TPA: ASCH domain-containing protein [Thermomicrobiales bacterium]|nr:ASCH domain-containing protein [Thermomicrobiales bacterium]
MLENDERVDLPAYRAAFLRHRPNDPPERIGGATADAFGNTPEMADGLAALVCSGVKTATSGLLWGYEAEGEPIPAAGDLSIILDGRGAPVCIIENLETRIIPFDAVDEQLAWEYGEGERTLAWWREHLWDYYAAECAESGWKPSLEMPLVVRRFQAVYPAEQQ